ncbi:hypothetical protein [Clostridium butyricum]|nr:hypothetical protein [Clostridium butyricum]
MIFSLKWFREKAKEILGHDDISLTLKSSGKSRNNCIQYRKL